MYEVAKTYRISEDSVAGAWWQPVFNISYIHSSVDGYTERGSDAALRVGKQESDNVIFGLGARMQGVVGENVLNTPAIMETRILGKAIAGRREGSARVGIPGINETVSVHGSDRARSVWSWASVLTFPWAKTVVPSLWIAPQSSFRTKLP